MNSHSASPATPVLKEAIVLAGGLGTRLRSAVPDIPKCLAPVGDIPFLSYVIDYFLQEGIQKFVFALGYKSEAFEKFLRGKLPSSAYQLSIEQEPLGTGGAIKLACQKLTDATALVLNGDTFFRIRPQVLADFHHRTGAQCTLSLRPMQNFDRYGVVECNEDHTIRSFQEKKFYEKGLINGGVYALQIDDLLQAPLPDKFSFEKDYLENPSPGRKLAGLVQDAYFIDIGIPEDYERAQRDVKKLQTPAVEKTNNLQLADLRPIGKNWTLFLDRDGVLNREKDESYIFHYGEFVFYEGVKKALAALSARFGRIILVTNQRGIGKGLMSEQDLHTIHDNMNREIGLEGGRIDAIYFASSLLNDHPDRKPNPGMALKARSDFPGIDLSKSIMVGNNLSDMEFGRNAGMYTVFLKTTSPDQLLPHPAIDWSYDSLYDFAKALQDL